MIDFLKLLTETIKMKVRNQYNLVEKSRQRVANNAALG
jgi:hypothetical protein